MSGWLPPSTTLPSAGRLAVHTTTIGEYEGQEDEKPSSYTYKEPRILNFEHTTVHWWLISDRDVG